MTPIDSAEPSPANANDPKARLWHEICDLVVRGIHDPASLTAAEVKRVSSVALLGMREIGADWDEPRAQSSKP